MRVNVYAEEMTNKVEIISKEIEGQTFTGLRFWLHLPTTLPDGTQAKGPFMHRPGDDDSSAITFWGKRDLRSLLEKSLELLDKHYDQRQMPLKFDETDGGELTVIASTEVHPPPCDGKLGSEWAPPPTEAMNGAGDQFPGEDFPSADKYAGQADHEAAGWKPK